MSKIILEYKMCEIKVSVICDAYNHGPFIRDALEGFVLQRTNFKYEVLIHDDASTDNTADIIREYEKKYPELIKPIYQTQNQYSKGVNITQIYNLPRLKGQYVALCEGDDYWTDPFKLQKQFDAMEAHPEIDICAHAASKIRASNGQILASIAPCDRKTVFSTEEVIAGGGGFVATNSLFYRRKLLENQPNFRKQCLLDYSLQIQGSLRGGMLYLSDNMSVYRVLVPGSWTVRMNNSKYTDGQRNKIKSMLDMVDQETQGKYHQTIKKAKLDVDFSSLELAGRYKELRSGELRALYNQKSLKWKIKLYLKEYFPWLLQLYRKK